MQKSMQEGTATQRKERTGMNNNDISSFLDQLEDERLERLKKEESQNTTPYAWAYEEEDPSLTEWGGDFELLGF